MSHLIRAYQVSGHYAAHLDPLDLHGKLTFPFRPCNTRDYLPEGYPEELTVELSWIYTSRHGSSTEFQGNVSSGGNKGYLEELASAPGKVTLA